MQKLLVLERFDFHARFCFSTSVSLTTYRLFYLEKPGPLGQVRVLRLSLEKRCKSLK